MVGPRLTPQERDILIRTVVGEAAGEAPVGQLAVAHVIANRMAGSGRGLSDVVFARNQFEPWGNPNTRAQLMALSPESPRYQRVAQALEPFFQGQSRDPTNGATHFYAPVAQAQLGRRAPSWDNGTGADIGNHRFFRLGYGGSGRGNPHGNAGGMDAETARALGMDRDRMDAMMQPQMAPQPMEAPRMNEQQFARYVGQNSPSTATNPAMAFMEDQNTIRDGYVAGRPDIRSPNTPPAGNGLEALGRAFARQQGPAPVTPVYEQPFGTPLNVNPAQQQAGFGGILSRLLGMG